MQRLEEMVSEEFRVIREKSISGFTDNLMQIALLSRKYETTDSLVYEK